MSGLGPIQARSSLGIRGNQLLPVEGYGCTASKYNSVYGQEATSIMISAMALRRYTALYREVTATTICFGLGKVPASLTLFHQSEVGSECLL